MEINSIPSAINSGLTGIKKAEEGVAESAREINRLNLDTDQVNNAQLQTANNEPAQNETSNRPTPSLEAEAVNLVVNEHLAKVNTKVIQTADDMIGSLIDTKV